MDAPAAPTLEARISPELRQLLADLRLQRSWMATGRAAEPGDRGLGGDRQDPLSDDMAPWGQLTLRRDGARPVRFRGALVLEVRSGHAAAQWYLRLFATENGEAVAQLAYLPPETLPARPVFRIAQIDSADALHRFITDTGPEQCFAVCKDASEAPAHRKACAMLRLPTDFPGLALPQFSPVQFTEGRPE